MKTDYQSIINGIFICGLPALNKVLENEDISLIIDLRAEAEESEFKKHVNVKHIPLIDGAPDQSHLLKEAIINGVHAYEEGKKLVLH